MACYALCWVGYRFWGAYEMEIAGTKLGWCSIASWVGALVFFLAEAREWVRTHFLPLSGSQPLDSYMSLAFLDSIEVSFVFLS